MESVFFTAEAQRTEKTFKNGALRELCASAVKGSEAQPRQISSQSPPPFSARRPDTHLRAGSRWRASIARAAS